ncbi:MAG: uL15 family ribosomal protein [Clostridia bacterium]|nr:uL15 family ribosomal protein [Clostridia bacterium]
MKSVYTNWRKLLIAVLASLFLFAGMCGITMVRSGEVRTAYAAEEGLFASRKGVTYTAYATFAEAFSNAEAEADGVRNVYAVAETSIALSEPIQVSGNVVLTSISLANQSQETALAVIHRAAGYFGALVEVGENASLTLKNITLDGGAEWTSPAALNGAIENGGAQASSAAIVSRGALLVGVGATVQNNHNTLEGGAIYAAGGICTLEGGVLKNNAADLGGAAIWAASGATVRVADDQSYNTAVSGNVSLDHRGSLTVQSGAALTVSGGTISAGKGDERVVYVYGGGQLSITLVARFGGGNVYLGNGSVVDVTGYRGTSLTVEVAEDRADGAIATRTAQNAAAITSIISVADPAVGESYLTDYEYRARYTRVLTEGGVEQLGYGGVGVNISQEEYEKLLFNAHFTDRVEGATVTVGGETAQFEREGEQYKASFSLRLLGEIGKWSVSVNAIKAEFEAVGVIYIHEGGVFEAPAGCEYVAEDGERRALSASGILPNDLKIESGVATFVVGGYSRSVFVGMRMDPVKVEEAQGALYDAENTEAVLTVLRFFASELYEYALFDGNGSMTAWSRADESGKVVFFNLLPGTAYTLAVRRPASGYRLPSSYVVLNESVCTLTIEESNRRYAFYSAYHNLLNEEETKEQGVPVVWEDVTASEINAALSVYTALNRDLPHVAAFPALCEWQAVMIESLPQAFVNDWRTNNGEILKLPLQALTDTTRGTYRELAESAARTYHSMAEIIGLFLKGNLEVAEKIEEIAESVQALLAEDMAADVMPKVRAIAVLDIFAADDAACDKFNLDSERENEQVQRLHDIRNAFQVRVEAALGIGEDSLGEIYRLVKVAGAQLNLQGYYERFCIEKSGEEYFSQEKLSNALISVMDAIFLLAGDADFVAEEYGAELALYKAYGKIWLEELFGELLEESLIGKLYAEELVRIEAIAPESFSDTEIAICEEALDEILREAQNKRELQLYFEALTGPSEGGRLSIANLVQKEKNAALIEELERAFEKIVAAEEGAMNGAVESGKLALYRTLAKELIKEHLAAAYSTPAEALEKICADTVDAVFAVNEGTMPEMEDEIERIFESGKQKLKVRNYYEKFEEFIPAESTLSSVYEKIDGAGATLIGEEMAAQKRASAYLGMFALYQERALLILESYSAEGAPQTAFVNAASEAIARLEYADQGEGEKFTDEALSALESEIEVILSQAYQQLTVQRYFEMLAKREGGVEARLYESLEVGIAAVEAARTLEEKAVAGFIAMRDLYKTYITATLEKHLYGAYENPAETLKAFLTEAEARLCEIGFNEQYTQKTLENIEEGMDLVFESIIRKFALQNYFDNLTGEAGVAKHYKAALEEILKSSLERIDQAIAGNKEYQAYGGMNALYWEYGHCVLAEIAEAYKPLSEVLANIYIAAQQAVVDQQINSLAPFDEQLKAVEAAIEVILKDFEAEMLLTGYFETLTGLTEQENKVAFSVTLSQLLAAIKGDAAPIAEKTEKAILSKVALYAAYAKLILEEYRVVCFGEEADPEGAAILEDAYSSINSLAQGEFSAEEVEELLTEIATVAENARGGMEGEMFLTEHPVAMKAFEMLAQEDCEAIAVAYEALSALSESAKAYLHTLAPAYENDFAINRFMLMLCDFLFKAEAEGYRRDVAEQIGQLFADYEADASLLEGLESIRLVKLARLAAIEYTQYAKDSANADPRVDAYLTALKLEMDAVCEEAAAELAIEIATDEVEKLCALLNEEFLGYKASQSLLNELDEMAVKEALQTAKALALTAVNGARENALEEGRAAMLDIRSAFASAVLNGYAEALAVGDLKEEVESIITGIAAAQTDGEKKTATLEGILTLYKANATLQLLAIESKAEIEDIIEEGEGRIAIVPFAYSTEAIAEAEEEIDGYLESAKQKVSLQEFYEALLAAHALEDELDKIRMEAFTNIDTAEEKAQVTLEGMRALSKLSLEIFTAELISALERQVGGATVLHAPLAEALEAIEGANEGTMSAVLTREEKKMLGIYAESILLQYEIGANAASLNDICALLQAQTKSLLGENHRPAIGQMLELDHSIAKLRLEVETELQGVAFNVANLYAILLEALLQESLKEPFNKDWSELANELSGSVEGAFAAVHALYENYASLVLSEVIRALGSYAAALRPIEEEALEEVRAYTQIMPEDVRFADHVASIFEPVAQIVKEASAKLRGEYCRLASGYVAGNFAQIEAKDLNAIAAMRSAYRALEDADIKAYLDEAYKGGYADFGARLDDEYMKSAFEKHRTEVLVAIEALPDKLKGELVAAQKVWHRSAVSALEYLPMHAQPEDYFAQLETELSNALFAAKVDVSIAEAQELVLRNLDGHYAGACNNRYVKYSVQGEAALLNIYESARKAVLAVKASDLHETEYEALLEEADLMLANLLAKATEDISKSAVIAVSKGVLADGSYQGFSGDEIWGIVENEGGMPQNASLEMFMKATDFKEEIYAAINSGKLVSTSITAEQARALVKDKELKATVEITLGGIEEFSGVYTVKVLLNETLQAFVGLQIATLTQEGVLELLQTRIEGEFLVFETTHFSEFYVLGEIELNLWWVIVILVFLLLIELAAIVHLTSKAYKKLNLRAQEHTMSVGGFAILAVLIPQGAVIVSIVLAVLIALAAIAIISLLVILYKKPKKKFIEETVVSSAVSEITERKPEADGPAILSDTIGSNEAESAKVEADWERIAIRVVELLAAKGLVATPSEVINAIPNAEQADIASEPCETECADETAAVSEVKESSETGYVEAEPIEDAINEILSSLEEIEEVAEDRIAIVSEDESAAVSEVKESSEAEYVEAEPIEDAINEILSSLEEIEEVAEDRNAIVSEDESVATSEVGELCKTECADETAAVSEVIKPRETDSEKCETAAVSEVSENPEMKFSKAPEADMPTCDVAVIPFEEAIFSPEIRAEVAASEVNALMHDSVAKLLITEGDRVAVKSKTGIVNVDTLGEYFESGELVTLEGLKERIPFFNKKVTYIKILARGKLSKSLVVEGDDFSLEAVKMIVLTGGQVIRTRRR